MAQRPPRIIRLAEPIKDYVHRAINAGEEMKNLTTSASLAAAAATTNNTGSLINLQPIAQGVNINERVGNVIRIHRIKIRAYWKQATLANTPQMCRYIVFRSKQQPNNTAPATSSLLATVGSYVAIMSGYNTASTSNSLYDILLDKTMVLQTPNLNNVAGSSGSNEQVININLRKKVLDRLVHYTGAGSADYGKGALFLAVFSESATGVTPEFSYGLQVWYKDG